MQCQSTHFTPSKGSTLYLCHDYFLEVNSLQSMYDHPSRFMLTLWIFVLAVEISYRSHALPHNLLSEKSTSPVFLNWKYPSSLNVGLLKGIRFSFEWHCTEAKFTYNFVSRVKLDWLFHKWHTILNPI